MLELYHFEACPFCVKVRQKLEELDLPYVSLPCRRGSKHRENLVKLGGREQVPFLVDPSHGVHLYESDEIIAYLEKTYGP